MNRQQVIGVNNQLPWVIGADLRHFRRHTNGKAVVMGRKTFESLGSCALPTRENIVITKATHLPAKGKVHLATSIDHAIEIANDLELPVCFIGGCDVIAEAIPLCDEILFTGVDLELPIHPNDLVSRLDVGAYEDFLKPVFTYGDHKFNFAWQASMHDKDRKSGQQVTVTFVSLERA